MVRLRKGVVGAVKKSHIGRWPRNVLTSTVKSQASGAHSSIARGSTWARRDRGHIAARGAASRRSRRCKDGGDPPGVDASYYHARAIEEDLPQDLHVAGDGVTGDVCDDGSLARCTEARSIADGRPRPRHRHVPHASLESARDLWPAYARRDERNPELASRQKAW